MICPPEEATASTAAARRLGYPRRVIAGKVTAPVEATLAEAEPEMEPSGSGGGQVHEALPRLARIQRRTKDDKDRHHADGDARQAAPDAAFGNGQRAQKTGQGRAGMAEFARNILPIQAVDQRQQRDQGQGPADGPARGLKHHHQQGHGDAGLERPFEETVLV